MSNILVYELDNKIYINLTNKCTNDCIFCLRKDKDDVCGQKLWLDNENATAVDVIAQLNKFSLSSEVIFCGYGEPLLKLDVLKDVAKYVKQNYPNTKIRINTNGHANYVHKRNIIPELKGLIDEISVSLNGATESEYDELSQPVFKGAYDEVKNFIKACADGGISTVASVVEGYKGRHLDLEKCEKIANDLGAKFRVREWIENGY
ncbi:TatD family nuclease-associated radical SAM protein [bacterium]|nr:TatD family nuclease-associated radical SAM protein [bacterium]